MRDMYMPMLFRYVEPYDWRYVIRFLRGQHPSRHFWFYNKDGFIHVNMVPLVPVDNVDGIKRTFEGNQVAEEKIQMLLNKVAQWRADGFQVFGFRPPTSVRIAQMEDEFSGYDIEDIRKRFGQAGGVWLHTEPGSYVTYDGHHLTGEAAGQFSVDLASQMKQHGWMTNESAPISELSDGAFNQPENAATIPANAANTPEADNR